MEFIYGPGRGRSDCSPSAHFINGTACLTALRRFSASARKQATAALRPFRPYAPACGRSVLLGPSAAVAGANRAAYVGSTSIARLRPKNGLDTSRCKPAFLGRSCVRIRMGAPGLPRVGVHGAHQTVDDARRPRRADQARSGQLRAASGCWAWTLMGPRGPRVLKG